MRGLSLLALIAVALAMVWTAVGVFADEPPAETPQPPAGAGGSSSGEGAAPTGKDPLAPESLLARIELLELQTTYLASREKALTAYVLETQDRATALGNALRRARQEGFTAGAISAPSRESLLAGLEDLSRQLVRGLPAITKEEQRYLFEIKARQRGKP
jgi:hypothetical protein